MSRWLFYSFDEEGAKLTGGDRSVQNLVRGVERKGITPIFVSQCEGVLTEQFQEEGVEIRTVPLPDVLDVYDKKALEYSLTEKARAAYALLQYNQNIRNIAQEVGTQGIWARGIRSVLHVGLAAQFSGSPLVWDIGVEQRPQGLIRALHGLGLLLSDRVVTQAAVQQEQIFGPSLASWYSGSLRTLHPGIADERAERLRGSGILRDEQSPTILNVGSIHPRKNQRMSLRAFECVHSRHPSASLIFVGPIKDDRYAASLRTYVHEQGLEDRVEFLGWRDDVPELLNRSSLLVLSSHREGVPHVIREAMFAQVPVVATAVGGVPEAVVDGETGFLVPETGVEQMAENINRLLSRPEERKRMGEKGFQFARTRFSRESWLAAYGGLLRALSNGALR